MLKVLAIVAVLSAAAVPAAQAKPPQGTPAANHGCTHSHSYDQSARGLRKALRHHQPLTRALGRRTWHYVSCTRTKHTRARMLLQRRAWKRWRRQNVCTVSRGNVALGRCMARRDYGWVGGEFSCLHGLWSHESGWDEYAHNGGSGAHGIPQALPGWKMGPGWESNPYVQIAWGLGYIRGRYGTPCGAYGHFNSAGWY